MLTSRPILLPCLLPFLFAVGLNAAPVFGQTIVQNQSHAGTSNQPGYATMTGGGDYRFAGDTFTGGPDATGIFGPGAGLFINQGSSATIHSGTYTGGNGRYFGGFILPGGTGMVIQTDLPVTINGGTFVGGYESNEDPENYGASVQSRYIYHPDPIVPAQVSIYGGAFLNSAGAPGYVVAYNSVYTFYGHDLTFLAGDGTVGTNNGRGTISGMLENNSASFTLNYDVAGDGQVRLMNVPVPEASTTFSLGLLLALGVGGMVMAAKRKKHCS